VSCLSTFGVLSAFLLTACFSGGAQAAQAAMQRVENLPDLIRKAEKGVFFIRALDAEGNVLSLGTGFLAKDKRSVLTSLHVIRPSFCPKLTATVEALDSTGRAFPVEGVKSEDEALDLVLLQLKGEPEHGFLLALASDRPPERGDFVLVLGHPNEFRFVSTDGIVSAVNTTREMPRRFWETCMPQAAPDVIWIQSSAAVSVGNSGGPMLNASGQVMGVMQLKMGGSGMSFALHVSSVRTFLAKPPKLISIADYTRPEAEYEALAEKVQKAYMQYASDLHNQLPPSCAKKGAGAAAPDPEHPGTKQYPQVLALADANRGRNVELKALLLMVMELSDLKVPDALRPTLRAASERLIERYRDDRRILSALRRKLYPSEPEAQRFLRALADKSADREIRAIAALSLAEALAGEARSQASAEEALALARRAAASAPEIAIEQSSVAKQGHELEERLLHSMPGCAAPDLSGKDQNGKDVLLSDLRGRYVVVAFWNPRSDFFKTLPDALTEFAQNYAGAPVSFIGVRLCNPDSPSAAGRQAAGDFWPFLTDDPTGRVANAWHVRAAPTLFVVDPQGVITNRIAARPASVNTVLGSTFMGFESMRPGEWKNQLKQALESIPALTGPGERLTTFLTQGPWLSDDNFLGSGTRTIFLRGDCRTSLYTAARWKPTPPWGFLLFTKDYGTLSFSVNLETGEAVIQKPEPLANRKMKLRDFPPSKREDSDLLKKIRKCLLSETWEWYQFGKKEGEKAYMKFRFKDDGTTDSTLLPAWEIMPSGQIWVYVYMGTYWAFELDIEQKTARNNLEASQIKDHKLFSAVTQTP